MKGCQCCHFVSNFKRVKLGTFHSYTNNAQPLLLLLLFPHRSFPTCQTNPNCAMLCSLPDAAAACHQILRALIRRAGTAKSSPDRCRCPAGVTDARAFKSRDNRRVARPRRIKNKWAEENSERRVIFLLPSVIT